MGRSMPDMGTITANPALPTLPADPENIRQTPVPLLCRGCAVRVAGICGVLDPQHLIELAVQTHKTRLTAGSQLIGEGAPIDSYANLMRGVVKLSKVTEHGNQQLNGLQFAPGFLGRLFGAESTVTLEAAPDVSFCVRASFCVSPPASGHRGQSGFTEATLNARVAPSSSVTDRYRPGAKCTSDNRKLVSLAP